MRSGFEIAVSISRVRADALRDAAHGARLLLRTPGFATIGLLVFAIGIGAATAILSVTDAVLARPLPVPRPERVLTIWQSNRETGLGRLDVAPGNAIDWMRDVRSFDAIAIAEPSRLTANIPGREPEYLTAAFVSQRFFSVLGTPMLEGRAFLPEEYRQGGRRVAIFSYAMWTERFGGDPAIVGRAVRLDKDDLYTVVGVMPPGVELRLFDNRASQPEPLVWLPKQGFNGILERRGPAARRRGAGRGASGTRRDLGAPRARVSRNQPRDRGAGRAVSASPPRQPA
jgi:putative ABC transport system permease protein